MDLKQELFHCLLAGVCRGKNVDLEKQQKILFAEENIWKIKNIQMRIFLQGKAGIRTERTTAYGRSGMCANEANDGYKPYRSHVFFAGRRRETLFLSMSFEASLRR